MKCEICKTEIKTGIAEKKIGTYVKDEKGKFHIICNECQKKHPTKKEILNAFVS